MRACLFCLFFITALINVGFAAAQETISERQARGSIPEELLRPARGESPRYPIDTVIGELGRGRATEEAFSFAKSICEGLMSIDMSHPVLNIISSSLREEYLTAINIVDPINYRIGGGREEADGAVSFLVRFIGRNQGITGELYIRRVSGRWTFDELLLDEAKDREVEQQESIYRNDFNPYERFY